MKKEPLASRGGFQTKGNMSSLSGVSMFSMSTGVSFSSLSGSPVVTCAPSFSSSLAESFSRFCFFLSSFASDYSISSMSS